MQIVAYTYEAAMHCPTCTQARFPAIGRLSWRVDDVCTDREGNAVHPVFSIDDGSPEAGELCDTCRTSII